MTDYPSASQEPAGRGPSRRTVLRTGGTIAWAVPAIVTVSAVPAFAASAAGVVATSNPGPGRYGGVDPFIVITNNTAEPLDPGLVNVRGLISDQTPQFYFADNWECVAYQYGTDGGKFYIDGQHRAYSAIQPGEMRQMSGLSFIKNDGSMPTSIDFVISFVSPPTGVGALGTSSSYTAVRGDGVRPTARAPRGARSTLDR